MNYYRTVTFQPPTETLTNFPVLVRIRNDRMGSRILSPKGWDVCFELDGNRLPFELDWYDAASGSGAWWVQVPTLSSSAPTSIKMLYGDASVTSDQSDPDTLWADYEFVYHFNVNSTTQPAAKGSASTFTNTPLSLGFTDGCVTGRALKISNNAGGSLYHGWTTNTTSGWRSYAITAIGTAGAGIECRTNSGIFSDLRVGGSNPGSGITYADLPLTRGEFAYVNFSHSNSSSPVSKVVANGAVQSVSHRAYIASPFYFAGTMSRATYEVDEIRLRNSMVSEDWQMYEYYNYILHSSYTEYSEEFHVDGTSVTQFTPWIYGSRILD